MVETKIMVVEDEGIVAYDIARQLTDMGYHVVATSYSCEEAVEKVGELRPDLVLMDIVLAGKMDGIEAADIIRSRWDIPVVFLTAHADQKLLERAKLVSPLGYILKPFEHNDLKVTVEMALYVSKTDKERRKSEEALRTSEAKFRELVEHINDVFYELDKEGIIQYASPSVEHLFGYPQSEAIGRPISDVLDPEETVVAIENVQKVMVGHIAPREYRVRCKSGEIRWIRVNSSPVTKGDQVVGIRGVMTDITERKQAQEALKETIDQLESRVRERTIELEETNIALRVLLKKGDKDQITLEENLQSNINQLVMPFLSKLKVSESNPQRLTYLNILETNLNNIVSPFINQLSAAYKNLTPKELQIAELIKQGKRSKEIAELFGISVGTVLTHRNKIRKKLDLKSKDANLRSHLLSLA